jgi:hypothetical protein
MPNAGTDMTPFLDKWIGFLDKIFSAGLLEVHASLDVGTSSELWSGIALNPGAKTVKWNESTVERINYCLLLWWYVYSNELRLPKRFLKNVEKPKSNDKYPRAAEAVKELKKALRTVIRAADEDEIPEDIVEARVLERLFVILDRVCRLTPEASAKDEPEEAAAATLPGILPQPEPT